MLKNAKNPKKLHEVPKKRMRFLGNFRTSAEKKQIKNQENLDC